MRQTKAIILAAGQGTRMKSAQPKVLHHICGKSMIHCVIDVCQRTNCEEITVVVGFEADKVRKALPQEIKTILQAKQLGTGHAVMQAAPELAGFTGNVMVLMGDAPLITEETLKQMIDVHEKENFSATVLTAVVEDPTGYGRMVKHGDELIKIVEHKDASQKEQEICEINSGMYCFDAEALLWALQELKPQNSQGEYYLTDALQILKNKGLKIGTFTAENSDEIKAANSRGQLAELDKILRKRTIEKLMDDGVSFIDPDSTYIGVDTKIGRDTVVYPGVITEGDVRIGENCVIGQNTHIVASRIGNDVIIQNSTILESKIDDYCTIGPYAYLRPKTVLGEKVKVGDFVEIKNTVIKNGSKVPHLSYLGDGEIGTKTNIGCGTIFVNYDSVNKHKTIVGDRCFIGCNTKLVAPVKVGDDAYTAAGSTITRDVPKGAVAIARSKQTNKEDYVLRLKKQLEKK